MARRTAYYFRETVSGIQRNGLITFAAVATVFISLFLLGGAQLIGREIGLTIDAQTEKVEVAIYLNDGITQTDLQALQTQLSNMPEVSHFRYESKDDAWHRYLKLFANQPDLINNTRKDALPASFRVKLVDPNTQIDSIAAQVGHTPGVERVVDQRAVLKQLFAVSNVLKTGAYVASIVMLVAAIALIGNTVRMAVFARRKEIGIMRLVGATNWFIRVPFLVEGMVAGLLGAGLAIGFLFILQHVFFASLHQTIQFLPVVAVADVIRLVPWIAGAGVLVAFLASYMAMRRFLEV
jgi:cell division transport system permease protein